MYTRVFVYVVYFLFGARIVLIGIIVGFSVLFRKCGWDFGIRFWGGFFVYYFLSLLFLVLDYIGRFRRKRVVYKDLKGF